MSPDAIVAAARALLGVPWRHMGRGDAGLDCIGLVLAAASRAGLALPDPGEYPAVPSGQQLRARIAQHMDAVPIAAVQDGDLLLFNMGPFPGHVGIAATHPTYRQPSCIHAYLPRRRVVEELLAPLRPGLTGAFRWRGEA